MRWMLTPETVVGRVGPEDEEETDGTTDQGQGLGQPLARGLADEPGGKERVEAHEMREGDQEAPGCEADDRIPHALEHVGPRPGQEGVKPFPASVLVLVLRKLIMLSVFQDVRVHHQSKFGASASSQHAERLKV